MYLRTKTFTVLLKLSYGGLNLEGLTTNTSFLVRLQDVYELDISHIAGGKIGERESAARLTAQVKNYVVILTL